MKKLQFSSALAMLYYTILYYIKLEVLEVQIESLGGLLESMLDLVLRYSIDT